MHSFNIFYEPLKKHRTAFFYMPEINMSALTSELLRHGALPFCYVAGEPVE